MSEPASTTERGREGPFGERLRRARAAAGLTQEELAERAGLTPNAISALERGEHCHPYPATVRALAAALGLTDPERAALAAAVPKRGRAPQAAAAPSALPAPLSSLIGREREVAAVSALLRGGDRPGGVRLVTLTGPGGVGKTRLALEVAAELGGGFAEGAAFVALAAVRDPALVAPTIAHALGLAEAGGPAPVDRLGAALRERHLLLVLDNLEHLLEATPLITDLLTRCPRLAVLATSRTTLRLEGEHDVPVPPLAVPDPERLADGEDVAEVAAIRLFVARARAVDPAFALTDENAGAVAAVCHRLDGLPLAIELAAARSRHFPPAALLPRLARRLPLLTGGRRDAPARHQTMRDAVAWSHELLDPEEQALYRRLSVFAGGFTLEAAEAVGAAAHGALDVLEGVAALADKSLLRAEPGTDGGPRYRMLETVREFALERLAAGGGEAAVRDAHAAWCLDVAEQAAPAWFGPAQARWLERFDAERDNLRAALAWLAESGGSADGVRLVGTLWPYWFARGPWAEAESWLERASRWSAGARTVERLRVLDGAWTFATFQGDAPRGAALAEEALGIAQEIGDPLGVARARFGLGVAASSRADHDQAAAHLDAALAALRGLGPDAPAAAPLTCVLLENLGWVALARGDDARAERLAEDALAAGRELGFTWGTVDCLGLLAAIAHRRGGTGRAMAFYRQGLELAHLHRDPYQLATKLDGVAIVAAGVGQDAPAARLFGAATRLYELVGRPASAGGRAARDGALTGVRARLGDEAFGAAWTAGQALPLAEVVAEARAVEAPPARPDGLTRREVEVLGLVAAGRTDREIADALFLSLRTVNTHVARLLAKLDVPTRRAAADRGRARGLLADADGSPRHT